MMKFLITVSVGFLGPLLLMIPLHFSLSDGEVNGNEMMMFMGSVLCVGNYVPSRKDLSIKKVVAAILLCLALSCISFLLHAYNPEEFRYCWAGPVAVTIVAFWVTLGHIAMRFFGKRKTNESVEPQ